MKGAVGSTEALRGTPLYQEMSENEPSATVFVKFTLDIHQY